MLTPNLEMAQRYLTMLDPEGIFTFQTFDDKSTTVRNKPIVRHGTLVQHQDELVRLNKAGAGVFVMVNRGDGVVRDGASSCRTNANVIAVRAHFADADGTTLESILEKSPPPHILVESSPDKWHLYWLIKDVKLEDFKANQKAIAQALDTDPSVNDLARVLRLPGFWHQKDEPFLVRLVDNLH